jgi:hypothetical protein
MNPYNQGTLTKTFDEIHSSLVCPELTASPSHVKFTRCKTMRIGRITIPIKMEKRELPLMAGG